MQSLKGVVSAWLPSSECDGDDVNMAPAAKSPVSPGERSHMTHKHDYEASNQRALGSVQSVWLKVTLGWEKKGMEIKNKDVNNSNKQGLLT